MAGSCTSVPGTACAQFAETRVGKKDPVLQILGSVLIVGCYFCSQRWKRGRQSLLHLPLLLQAPLPPAEVTSGRFEGPVPSFSPFIFHFSPFVSQALKIRSFKSNCIYGGKFNVTEHIQGKAQNRHKKTLSLHLGLTLGTEIAYNNHKHTKNLLKANLGEGGESDFQSYHIIKFKCPVFNLKS